MVTRPKNIREDISRRSWAIAIALIFLGACVIYRIYFIQNYEKFHDVPWIKYISRTVHLDTIPPMRGNIYANDGSLMATSLPYYEVSIDPIVADSVYFYTRVDSIATLLANTFRQKTRQAYYQDLVFARKEFERNGPRINRNIRLLKRKITYREYNLILNQPFEGYVFNKKTQKKELKEWRGWPFFRRYANSNNSKGGKLTIFYERYNPFGSLAERTIGDLNRATKQGAFGLEASFNKHLAGKPGVGLYRILNDRTFMPEDDDERLQAVNGIDVHTTLDINFQDIAETSLHKTLRKYQADYGTVIVMEVATGAIKAMVNLARVKNDTNYAEVYNHALAQRANPGSTFKLATMVAALEEGKVTPNTMIATGNGTVRYGKVTVEDTKAHGTISVKKVLEQSSNVGMHLIMKKSGFYESPRKYIDYLRKFHLNQLTGIPMSGEALPLAPEPRMKNWDGTSATRLSYGYVWELTPLQTLCFYNAVANNGYWVRPRIVSHIGNADRIIQSFEPQIEEKPIASEQTIRQVQQMLEGVVADRHGTANIIYNKQYKIAGKTGTAQLIINKTYSKKGQFNVSFAGYFPANVPKYSCIVFVSYPKGGKGDNLYAGSVAAPVFKEVADRVIGYDIKLHSPIQKQKNKSSEMQKQLRAGQADDLRIVADEMNIEGPVDVNGWVAAKKEKGNIVWENQDTDPNKVPNLKGMSLRDALYLLENHGFKVNYTGRGKVIDYQYKDRTCALILK